MQAVFWYRKAADEGYAEAQARLGTMYMQGDEIPQDIETSKVWLGRAADQGNVDAAMSLYAEYGGVVLLVNGISTEWRIAEAAENEDPRAQLILGLLYENGQQNGPENGTDIAASGEINRPDHGEMNKPDYKEAEKWYRRAALHGQAHAQYLLGLLYVKGLGVTQDFTHAHMWMNLAAVNSNETGKKARESRELIAKKMTRTQIETAQELARQCQLSKFQECD